MNTYYYVQIDERDSAALKISVDDLPGIWRVDVERCWRGLSMVPTFGATLRVRHATGNRWHRRGKVVYNDDGPIQAISDLLSALDLGVLE